MPDDSNNLFISSATVQIRLIVVFMCNLYCVSVGMSTSRYGDRSECSW